MLHVTIPALALKTQICTTNQNFCWRRATEHLIFFLCI